MSNYSELMQLLATSVPVDFAKRVKWLLDIADALDVAEFDGTEDLAAAARTEVVSLLADAIQQRGAREVAR